MTKSTTAHAEDTEARRILSDQVNRLFGDLVTKEDRTAAEENILPQRLWRQVEDNGLPGILTATDNPSGAWNEAFVIVRAIGRFAVPAPLAETILASWLLHVSGLPVPPGPMSIALASPEKTDTPNRFQRVPWAAQAEHIVSLAEGHTHLVPKAAVTCLNHSSNIAKEPRVDIELALHDDAVRTAQSGISPGSAFMLAALIRAGQMAGALDAILDFSVTYAKDRTQFGRPLAKFQAIQQQLAALAGDAAAANAAAAFAFAAAGRASCPAALENIWFDCAAAKSRAEDAAGNATSIAHQVHGAIGFTYEHDLHFFTRRLWSWRSEYGNQAYWAGKLGAHARSVGGNGLWEFTTAR